MSQNDSYLWSQSLVLKHKNAFPTGCSPRRLTSGAIAVAICLATSAASETATSSEQLPSTVNETLLDWSGLYARGILGFGVGNYGGALDGGTSDYPSDGEGRLDGEAFGVAAGYNLQSGNSIYGAELDLMKTNNAGSENCGNPSFSCNFEVDAIASFSGRFGYLAQDSLMVYGSAGFALATTTAFTEGPVDTAADADMTGYVLGVGLEYGISDRISLRASAKHFEFGDQDYVISEIPETATIQTNMTRIEMGLIYHF